jgi:hypothetical protein
VPGVYGRLLEHERENAGRPDPSWLNTGAGLRGEPCPEQYRENSYLLEALELGIPVEVPSWRLGGHSEPDERFRRMWFEDRSIVGWMEYSDDLAVPIRRARR